MACRTATGIRLLTRNGNNWSDRFPLIVAANTKASASRWAEDFIRLQ
jgi:ATP-dependent DNA ligase